ncbi:MAG: DNA methyltransferase [Lentisphaeria bacterium]
MGYTLYYNPQTKHIVPVRDYDKVAIDTNEESKVYKNDSSLIDKGYVPVRPGKKNGMLHRWRWGFETCEERVAEIVMQESKGTYSPYFKQNGFNPPKNTWNYGVGTTQLKNLFGDIRVFDFSKSPNMLKYIVSIGSSLDGIILDFFSGSATTAHAVMQLNAEDGGHRKFIMVQLPEVCEEGTEAAKAGYKNICEIGKERIRRAARKIREENSLTTQNQDLGFKVFKLDTSNIIPWNPEPDKIELLLRNAVENILVGRTRQDLLYEVLLKCNLPLTLPIEERKFGGNTVYIVGAGALAICLDTKIPQTIAEEIVKLRDEYAPIVPMQVVFRDNGFTDVTKTNALQILKQAGFEEKSVQTI